MISHDCYFLDKDDKLLFIRDDASDFVVSESEYTLDATFPILNDGHDIQDGMKIGFYDIDGNFVLYEIVRPEKDALDMTVTVAAYHAAMTELLDDVIVDVRPTTTTAGAAVSAALNGTRWALRSAQPTGQNSCRFWYSSVWNALQTVVERWGCSLSFSWEINDAGIVARYVDVINAEGTNRGKRFELDKDIDTLSVVYDDSEVVTALYGRGKGQELETDDGGTAYGRKLSFSDVVWSKASGDPVDKPAGQEWVEDSSATAAYGRSGRKRVRVVVFDDCEDPEQLLSLTWNTLQKLNRPKITVKASVIDLERVWGRTFEAVRVNDYVSVIADPIGLETTLIVSNVKRNYVHPENTQIVLGTKVLTIDDIQAETNAAIKKAKADAEAGAQIAKKNPDLLKGYIDTMTTHIMSSGTKMFTDETDGSLVFENDQGTAAVKITGAGILISSTRVDGQWKWSTAMTGAGIVADTITSGVLQANLIRILGTNRFYWDAANIIIQDPDHLNKQIRIGLYDGLNYGIAYTTDGGQTWQSAIGFNGIILGSGTVKKDTLSEEVKNQLENVRGILSIKPMYLASELDYGVTASTQGWTETIQTINAEKPHLWTYSIITCTDTTTSETKPIIIGSFGAAGESGNGIQSIASKYGMSASPDAEPETWVDDVPEVTGSSVYLWTYEIITYTDGTTSETTHRISGYLGGEEITISKTEPTTPEQDHLWLDTSAIPAALKRYDALEGWQECTVSRNELNNMANRISAHDTKFIVMDDKIAAKVSQTDYQKDMNGKANTADVQKQFEAAADLNAKNLLLKFTEATQYTDDKTQTFEGFISEVITYMKFDVEGLTIGKQGSDFKTKITNEKMSFLQGTQEVAFIMHSSMYITEARITDRLSIGTETNGYFDWVTEEDGLGLKWK